MSIFGRTDTAEESLQQATCEDFQQLFTEQMGPLHTLAYLLTADEAMAEACFVAGLEDSMDGNLVFRQWARSWARRAIIRNAVRLLAPQAESSAEDTRRSPLPAKICSQQESLLEAVISLPTFERFVFVISVLEGHAPSDTASLLGCTNTQLSRARARALQQIAGLLSEMASDPAHDAVQPHWYSRLEIA